MERRVKLFSSGRLCLFGEHSDWAGTNRTMNSMIEPGRAIVTGIEQGIYAEAYCSELFTVIDKVSGVDESSFSCEMDRDILKESAKKGGFYSYVCGVASYICEWYRVGGITIEIYDRTLPIKSGLSSSAAVCVLVTKAFNQLYDLHLNTLGIMNIAYWGEQRTPSRCGRLDQACAFGVAPVIMVFDGHDIEVERIQVRKTLHYVFADLMASKDTVRILADLNRGYPFASNETEIRLHEALGVDNNNITKRAVEYISNGEIEKLGLLMTEAQALFDKKVAPMSPKELASPVLHEVLADSELQDYIYGGKGVGSQGDGTVQFLAKDEETQEKLYEYLINVRQMKAYKLTIRPNSEVRKAVIPVAGFGTRLYPATRGIKKAFFPVIGKDGLAKPIIMVLLEELISSGIEEICLVINPGEKQYYEDFFRKPLSIEHYRSLPIDMQKYEDIFRDIAGRVSFVIQNEQKGFGHAVFQTKEFSNGEPIVLLLGDTIFDSKTSKNCVRQLMEAFDVYGKSMVALRKVPLNIVPEFGIFAGTWENKEKTVIDIDRIKEKPSSVYAENFLSMSDPYGETAYYGAFGAYILTKEIYEELGIMCTIQERENENGEVQLTEAFERVIKTHGIMGFTPDGESFDIGNSRAYRDTFCRFGA